MTPSTREPHYTILGIERTADTKVIRAAYRKGALRYHPDKQKTDAEQAKNVPLFRKIQEAYETLSNEKRRVLYDRSLPVLPKFQHARSNSSTQQREVPRQGSSARRTYTPPPPPSQPSSINRIRELYIEVDKLTESSPVVALVNGYRIFCTEWFDPKVQNFGNDSTYTYNILAAALEYPTYEIERFLDKFDRNLETAEHALEDIARLQRPTIRGSYMANWKKVQRLRGESKKWRAEIEELEKWNLAVLDMARDRLDRESWFATLRRRWTEWYR